MNQSGLAKKSVSNSIVEYKRLSMNGVEYNLGDCVMIKEYSDDSCYGTLVKIWKNKDKTDPMARIRWFYKPTDIFGENYDFISEAELLDSDHEQDIWVVCLYGLAKVLSLEEYHSLEEVEDDVFFSRCKYFHKEHIFRPPFEEWKRTCTCNTIINPDHLYIACDICTKLFHPLCVDYNKENDDSFICSKCLENFH